MARRWLSYLTGAGIATQLALGITAWWSSREVDDSVVLTKSAWDGVKDVVLLPGSWPLLLMLVVAVGGGGQRSVSPDATMTAGPVSSTRSSAVQVTVSVPPGTSTR